MKKLVIYLMVYAFATIGKSQNEYGSAISNFNTSAAARLNPSEAGRMQELWNIAPFAINGYAYNNYFSLDLPYSPYKIINNSVPKQYKGVHNKPIRNWNWISTQSTVDKLNFKNIIKIQGPAVFFKVKKTVFGFSEDFSSFTKVLGVKSKIANEKLKTLQNNTKFGLPTSNDNFANLIQNKNDIRIAQHLYSSINFTVARNFELIKEQDFAIGATYKIVNSFGGLIFGLKSDQLAADNLDKIAFNAPEVNLKELYGRNNKFAPHGMGAFDLGLTWTYRNKETKRRYQYNDKHAHYKFKTGLSILDIGNLVYTRTITTQLKVNNVLDLSMLDKLNTIDPAKIYEEIQKSLDPKEAISFETVYGVKEKIGLPTRFVLTNDFEVKKNFYLNLLILQNLRNRNNLNNINYDGIVQFSPRLEHKHWEISLPTSFRKANKSFTQGLGLRFYNFYVSTQNILPFFNARNASEGNIYLGFHIQNFKGKFKKAKYPYLFFRKRGCSQF